MLTSTQMGNAVIRSRSSSEGRANIIRNTYIQSHKIRFPPQTFIHSTNHIAQLFPFVHGTAPGSEVELIALLAQLAMQLEKVGTTPSHRFGIAALLGQHLMMILRAQSTFIRDSLRSANFEDRSIPLSAAIPGFAATDVDRGRPVEEDSLPLQSHIAGPLLTSFDPFFSTPAIPDEEDLIGEGYAEILKELFGQGFGGMT